MATTQETAKTALVYYWDEMLEVPLITLEEAFEEVIEQKFDSFYLSATSRKGLISPDWVTLKSEALRDYIASCSLVYAFAPQNFYFEIIERESETLIFLKYQFIIGSRLVAKLDLEGDAS